jgi:ribosomal protein S18 acetylase RimI-like enzyme
MINIRKFKQRDWPATWAIIEPVFRLGETYSFSSDISESDAMHVWVQVPEATFVAEDATGQILGTYFLKPNQPGQGSHVCNCGYLVDQSARGKGVASAMCIHSQSEAVRRHYRGMQYNLVVSSNTGAIRLWQKHGFEIVGTLAEAFRHPKQGYIDAYVMYKRLET